MKSGNWFNGMQGLFSFVGYVVLFLGVSMSGLNKRELAH